MGKKKSVVWEPENFEVETSSVWSFPDRGDWATHDAKWRGNWSPYIPRNVILLYSDEGDVVLDQFVGGGTTLVEAKLLHRHSIGIDVNDKALERCREKTDFSVPGDDSHVSLVIRKGDARNLDFIDSGSIDLICTHPPYANIIHYSEGQDINEDLSNYKPNEFLERMKQVASECYRVLKKDKYCAILMGDARKNGHVVPLAFNTMQIFLDAGFVTKEIIIKEQHNCKATGYWKSTAQKYKFMLLAHEYLFVFHKK
ncbi:MAG: methyltransferase domain-containing protein [Clostridia bacterium]|nr:methyltransferase domain-containing protein [Clostridia bacterium]